MPARKNSDTSPSNHATHYKGLVKQPPKPGHVLTGEPRKNRLKRVKPKARPT